MTKNDNENKTTYGISDLTPTKSVNIGQSDNTTTPIWSNGILNRIEKLQELTNDSISFGNYNIFEQININDISIDSSIFKDAVDDKRDGEEQVLLTPIEMCTLHKVVDKVLPFAPYVYKNYYVIVDMVDSSSGHNISYPKFGFLMTDDASTYCPTYSQINRSSELSVILYKDKTYKNGRMFRFDGDKMNMPQLTMKKSGAKMNYANKNLVNIDDVDVVRKSYRIIVLTHNFSYTNDDNLKNGISMSINGCAFRDDLTSNSEGSGIYVFETNIEAMPFNDMYLQCRYHYNGNDLFNEDIDMFYLNNIKEDGTADVGDNFSYTISNRKMTLREAFLFFRDDDNDYYKSYEKIQIGKLLKGGVGMDSWINLPLYSQTIEDDVYIDIYARIKDRAVVSIGVDGYVNIMDDTYESGGDMIIESPAYSIVYHTLYRSNDEVNLKITSSDLVHRPYISYKLKNARTQKVISYGEKINLIEDVDGVVRDKKFYLKESVNPTDKYYLWVNTIEASIKKTITLNFYGSYFAGQNALSVLSVTFNKFEVKGTLTPSEEPSESKVSYEYITKEGDDTIGCQVVFTISDSGFNDNIENGVIIGWHYLNNQNISSQNMSFTYDESKKAYTASHLFPLISEKSTYNIYFNEQTEIKLSEINTI